MLIVASQEGFDSEGYKGTYFTLFYHLRLNIGCVYVVELLILGVDCCKLLHASYGRPKCQVLNRQFSVIDGLVPRPGGINPYPTAFPYGNGMVLHFYQQQESSTTKTVHKVINKGLKTYV